MDLKERMLPAPRDGGFRMEGYWVWCGSVIKAENGRYYMFASRWPKTQNMHPGWLFQSEIVRASSDNPCGPFQFEEVVIGDRGPQYWDGRMAHNPRIFKHNNQYILYYTGTTYPFAIEDSEVIQNNDYRTMIARANKRIGIAVADCITGPFIRRDEPILCTRPDYFDNVLTSNPAPYIEEDGSVYMIYKSRSYRGKPYKNPLHGPMNIGIAKAEHFLKPHCAVLTSPLFDQSLIEDPFVWKENGTYHMIAKDMFGTICGEKHGGVYAASQNGIDWKMKQNYLAYSRTVLWDDQKVEKMGSMERPFILFENGEATHMYFATSDGRENGFLDAKNTWNMVIPLKKSSYR